MYTLESQTGGIRLLAPKGLTTDDFGLLARDLGVAPVRARKVGYVAARQASGRESVTTLWNGKETTNVAEPGDMIATNLGADRKPLKDGAGNLNVYVIKAKTFPSLYARDQGSSEQGDVYRAISTVMALPVAGGFELLAPWGQSQSADAGYILLNGQEVYGNNRETFDATYEVIAG